MIAVTLLFGLVMPLIESVGVIFFSGGSSDDLLQALMGAGTSEYWKLWVLGFVILASWTSNSANLYSAAASLQATVPQYSPKTITLFSGTVGTLLACLNLMDNLGVILEP